MSSPLQLLEQVIQHGVVPVIRTSNADDARMAVACLKEAGFRTFEITMTIPGAIPLIAELSSDTDLLIGAGTVFNGEDTEAVVAAGARYVVSPCVTPAVGLTCERRGVPSLMGTMTPTEVFLALQAKSTAVKLFPAASLGPGHLKAMRSVFPNVAFMPTGGVDAENIASWFKAGAACVGVGGKLVDEGLLRTGNKDAIIAAGRRLIEAYRAIRAE